MSLINELILISECYCINSPVSSNSENNDCRSGCLGDSNERCGSDWKIRIQTLNCIIKLYLNYFF